MASWDKATWESSVDSGVPRRSRRSGEYLRYVPDPLVGLPVILDATLDTLVASAERAIRGLGGDSGRDLAGISRFLLRSEPIASSLIEGIAPSARQVDLAEFGHDEEVRGVTEWAQLVANNMTVVREATTRLVAVDTVTVRDIEELQAALLPKEPRHHGIRLVQNWIGGSDWHPIDAAFVPPRPDVIPALTADPVAYLNGVAHAAVVQAALVQAQFETIHPFTDGNGRVGRALIHTALARRGLTQGAVLPVSRVLATLRDDYVRGLTEFRHTGAMDSNAAHTARGAWIGTFARAVIAASAQAAMLTEELFDRRQEWSTRLELARAEKGISRGVRSDSATAQILHDLPGSPVLTPRTVKRIHQVSTVAAIRALEELADAGILEARSTGPRSTTYVATEVLALITRGQAPRGPVEAVWSLPRVVT